MSSLTLRRKIRKSYRLSITAITLLATSATLANPSQLSFWPFCNMACQLNLVLSLGVGGAFSSDLDKSRTFTILNPATDEFYIYKSNNSNQSHWLVDAFAGVEWQACPLYAVQLGLGYNQTWNFEENGTFLQGADVQSQDEFNYHFNIKTSQVLAEGKFLYHDNKWFFHPYLTAGLGAAFNEVSDYTTNVPPFLTFTRVYEDHTETSFSYMVGIGIDFDVFENFRLGVGYRFTDLGAVKLGGARINTTTVNGSLGQNHFYVNQVLAQITFLHLI